MTDEMMNLRALVEKTPDSRSVARHDRLCRRAADGAGGRRADRRGARREEREPAGAAQRLPRSRLGDARRHRRAAHPEAAQGQLLPELPGAAADGREGADGGDPGSLHPGHLDPLGRRPGQGDGHDRHLQEPGQPAVRGDRRAGQGVPRSADRGRLAVSVDRRHLREGSPGRPHRVGRRDRRGRRQYRRPARGARHGHRSLRGRDVLDGLPAQARPPRPARRQAGDLRRP